MAAPIKRKTLVDEMEGLSDAHFVYLHPHTGEIVLLSSEEINAVEMDLPLDTFPEWQQGVIEQARTVVHSTEYLRLPTHDQIDEYAIMERFCATLDDPHLRTIFLEQIRGSGAFRRFRQLLQRHGLETQWYAARTEALEAIVTQWLEAHQIPYE